MEKGDLWDTGKIVSEECLHIRYGGKKLQSGMKVFWKVRVWDGNDTASDWSSAANWEMSFLDAAEWNTTWIGTGEDENPDSPETFPAPYFRKELMPQIRKHCFRNTANKVKIVKAKYDNSPIIGAALL